MLSAITLILGFQFIGELLSRFTGIPVPGPVIGMILLLVAVFINQHLIDDIRQTANVLLANLAVMFVPAGVGIMRQGDRLVGEGIGIVAVIVISTVIAMLVTAYTIIGVQKLLKMEIE